MKRRFLSIAWIGVIFLVVFSVAAGQPTVTSPTPEKVPVYQPKHYPFDGGERAVYKASWNGIPVATAVISTTSQMIDGKKFYNVRVEAKTSASTRFDLENARYDHFNHRGQSACTDPVHLQSKRKPKDHRYGGPVRSYREEMVRSS